MSLYKCSIISALGEKKTVLREADDESSLRGAIKAEKCHLVSFNLVKEKKKSAFLAVRSKVKPNEVTNFLRQFAVMVQAGIPISDALNSLRQQKFSSAFRVVLQTVYLDVGSGVLLSEAFGRHPKVFPKFFVSMVGIGEASGSLDRVLTSMANYYENDRRIKKKAVSSMVYPCLLIGMVFVVSLFVMLFIIPRFRSTIDELGGDVPAITRVIMNCSDFVRENIFVILISIAALLISCFLFFMTKTGRFVKDWLLFHIPIISSVQKNLITARFARAFVILIDSGMDIVDCLENLKRMLGNQVFSKKFNFTIEEVKRGRRLAPSIAATGLFPPILNEMINVGEQSGNIEEVLDSTGKYFDECVEASIAKAIAALEPIMIVLLGIIVGVVILAVLLPIMSLMNSI